MTTSILGLCWTLFQNKSCCLPTSEIKRGSQGKKPPKVMAVQCNSCGGWCYTRPWAVGWRYGDDQHPVAALWELLISEGSHTRSGQCNALWQLQWQQRPQHTQALFASPAFQKGLLEDLTPEEKHFRGLLTYLAVITESLVSSVILVVLRPLPRTKGLEFLDKYVFKNFR